MTFHHELIMNVYIVQFVGYIIAQCSRGSAQL